MGPLIQQICLATFLIFFACSSAPVADGTETECQSTSESTCTVYGLNCIVWFAGCVTFGIILFLEVVFWVWYKFFRDANQNMLGGFLVVGGEDRNMNLDLPHNEARSHEVDVILDGKTAHSQLKISHNGKVVERVKLKQGPPTEIDKNDIDKHFDEDPYVLGSMGRAMRAYWEVSVKEKKDWVLGVTRPTSNRKGQLVLSPNNGFWVIGISDDKDFTAFMDDDDVHKEITLHRVGIFLDYLEKKVSFYNADNGSLIYSFTNGPSYEDDVLPLFSPWNNDTDPITILSIESKKSK